MQIQSVTASSNSTYQSTDLADSTQKIEALEKQKETLENQKRQLESSTSNQANQQKQIEIIQNEIEQIEAQIQQLQSRSKNTSNSESANTGNHIDTNTALSAKSTDGDLLTISQQSIKENE
ncbi:MAG: FlxA-like protein [Sporolactobacillus laevolacticus]|nr:FlxA-like protein [Sporolactobacillus laevolacticus]